MLTAALKLVVPIASKVSPVNNAIDKQHCPVEGNVEGKSQGPG